MNGEKAAAQAKLARLLSRFDFDAPDPTATADIFSAEFRPASTARRVWTFPPADMELASCVKWAIEHAAGIQCCFRGGELLAEATADTADKLAAIALHISESIRALSDQFAQVAPLDRNVFIMGLYDGMMNESRQAGAPLPSRATVVKVAKAKKKALTTPPGLNMHPYSLALPLGRQIRFNVSASAVCATLERTMQNQIET